MRGHITTERVDIDTALCTACGRCVRACSSGVLKVSGPKHLNDRHVRVVRPRDCHGCLSCASACREGAIVQRSV